MTAPMTGTDGATTMDFSLTEEQQEVAALATKIFAGHDVASGKGDDALWAALAGAGLVGVAVREDAGGAGHGLLEHCGLLAAAGAAAATVPLWAVTTAAMVIDHAGTPGQRALLRDVMRGATRVTLALHEPDGGDPWAPATTVRGGALHGVKTCVPALEGATRVVVSALRGDGQPGLFLVAPSDAGATTLVQVATTGEDLALLTLDGVPAEPLGDAATFTWLLERATIGLCAFQLGIADRVLRMTASYTTERTQFDRPIATFQAVAQRAADAYIDVETMRLTLWEAAWRLATGLPAARELAVAKVFAAEAGQRVTYAAQHLHGGIGFDLGYPLARYYPLSKWVELQLGGAAAHLARLGALLARAT
jgi:alkylation response protein AidB-like acyl-CoA dehydrogenase